MTLVTQKPRVTITGNGTLGPYNLVDEDSVPIRFVSTSHVKLTRYASTTAETGTALVLDTDFSVAGTQDARTFTLIGSQEILTTSQRIVAERSQTYTQDLDLTTGGAFNAESVEAHFDKIGEYLEELKTKVDRRLEASPLDSIPSTVPLKANATEGDLLVYDANKNLIPVAPTDLDISAALLGSGWSSVLQLPAAGILDNLAGIRFVATYAALTALVTATGLSDNSIYCTYGRSVEEDGGFGFWRYDSSSTATANGGTILAIDGGGAGRFFREMELGQFYAAWFGVIPDGSTDSTSALNAAWAAVVAAGGGILWLPEGTIKCTGALAINGSNVTTRGMGRKATILSSTYTGGPAVTLGDGAAQTLEYAFENIYFIGVASQTYFKTRWVRGLYIRKCTWYCDRFLSLGEADDGTGKPTYIVHLIDCPDAYHLVNETPTLHHMYAENFAGQFVMTDVFVEGSRDTGISGFYASDNIQTRIDHFIVSGGYFSRFYDNYSFIDARIVNMFIATTHLSEGALRNAIRLEVTSATAKAAGDVGWERVFIGGSYSSVGSNAVYVRCERAGVGVTSLVFGELVFTSENVQTPMYIQNDAGEPMEIISITSITVDMVPTNASQDIVFISGGSGGTTIESVAIGQIVGRATTNAFRSAIRVQGRIGRISHGVIAVENCTTPLDDQTSTTPMALTAATAATTDYTNVLDQSAGATRPMQLQEQANYYGGIAVATPRAKTATLQAWRLTIINTAGTIQHKITGVGDDTNAGHADYIAKLTSPSTSLQNTPDATDSSTAFVGGGKISSGDPSRFIFDLTAAQTTNLSLPHVAEAANTVDTDLFFKTTFISSNVNGVTQNRFAIEMYRTSDGGSVSINATNIDASETIAVDVIGYFL